MQRVVEGLGLKHRSYAWTKLGEIYYRGDGVEKDYEKVHFYFEKASKQTVNLSAQSWAWFMFGLLYGLGYGVKKNITKGCSYLKKAVDQTDDLCYQLEAIGRLAKYH